MHVGYRHPGHIHVHVVLSGILPYFYPLRHDADIEHYQDAEDDEDDDEDVISLSRPPAPVLLQVCEDRLLAQPGSKALGGMVILFQIGHFSAFLA